MKRLGSYSLWNATIFVLLAMFSCQTDNEEDLAPTTQPESSVFEVKMPKTDPKPTLGQDVDFEIVINDWSKIKGDVVVSLDGREIMTINQGQNEASITISTDTMLVGLHRLTSLCNKASGQKYIISKRITVLSDVKPGFVEPELVQMFPHSESAFTQGLTFWENKLMEGTGLNKESSVREVELLTGNVIRKKELDEAYFGEGITIHKGKLYQITWKSQVGFIYDPSTFDILDQFAFHTGTGEGWGLTSDGEHLIISEGTEKIYFVDDSTFKVVKQLSVADNVGLVGQLNELEYYQGNIYANVYGTEIVVEIDAVTGKVLNKYDMAFLRGEFDPTFKMDVFNGIAIDPSGRMFVTGKRWPRLLEVKIPNKTAN